MNRPAFRLYRQRLASALAACLVATAATAATPPSALYTFSGYEHANPGYGTQFISGDGSQTWLYGNGTFSAQAGLGGATAAASMNVDSTFNFGATNTQSVYASGGVQYDFVVVASGGFSVGQPEAVPFIITGFAQAQAWGSAYAQGKISLRRSPDDPRVVSPGALVAQSAGFGCGYSGGFFNDACGSSGLSISGLIVPYYDGLPGIGEIARVTLLADVRITAGFGVPRVESGGIAFVDPVIVVDPAYAAAHPGISYSVLVNPAVAAVPEPASALTMLAGVAVLLLARRRRD